MAKEEDLDAIAIAVNVAEQALNGDLSALRWLEAKKLIEFKVDSDKIKDLILHPVLKQALLEKETSKARPPIYIEWGLLCNQLQHGAFLTAVQIGNIFFNNLPIQSRLAYYLRSEKVQDIGEHHLTVLIRDPKGKEVDKLSSPIVFAEDSRVASSPCFYTIIPFDMVIKDPIEGAYLISANIGEHSFHTMTFIVVAPS